MTASMTLLGFGVVEAESRYVIGMPSTSRDSNGKSFLYLFAKGQPCGRTIRYFPLGSGRIVAVARGSIFVPSLSDSAAAALAPTEPTQCRIQPSPEPAIAHW